MTRIIMSGCNGKMGQMITSLVAQDEDAQIVAGIDTYMGIENTYPVFASIAECSIEADAIIDFSAPACLAGILEYAIANQVPAVLCTTGYTPEQIASIEEASNKVAILKSANMSMGINLLMKLLKEAAPILDEAGFDIEIVERHHNLKKDAPSGTALALADSVNESLDGKLNYVYDRSQRSEARDRKELGLSAVRGGTIVGDHDVIFAGLDEVITFSHSAYSKGVFGKGAIQAAKFIKGKKPAHYEMSDVINAG